MPQPLNSILGAGVAKRTTCDSRLRVGKTALALRSLKADPNLLGIVSQWSFGPRGFESHPQRHFSSEFHRANPWDKKLSFQQSFT